ncbi:MAG TPA: PAS domain S-box protein [Ohtaekwangia sp.]|uniref:PAS domain-containing sensor histidine kinase n=1 Tax=Ohtaekwangia sp. TaxID=2066019 RepID=UPI002F9426F2
MKEYTPEVVESLLKSIVNSTPSAVFVKDLSGKYILVNDEFARHFPQHTVETIIGKTAFDLFHSSIAEELVCNEQTIIQSGTSVTFEAVVPVEEGNRIMLTNKFPLKNSKGEVYAVCGVATDVTHSKRSESNLSAIFNSTHVSIIETDAKGIIRSFNRGAEILLGYTADEVVGIHTPMLIHVAAEIHTHSKELTNLTGLPVSGFDTFVILPKLGKFESREWTYVRKDGSTFPVQLVVNAIKDSRGEITGFLGIATDISEIKQAQQHLAERKQMTESIVSTVSDGIVLQDEHGIIIQCNQAARQILMLSNNQLVGHKTIEGCWKSIHEDGSDFPGHTHPATVTLTTGKPVRNQVMGIYKENREVTWILINSEPIHFHGTTRVQYVVTSFTDITNIKEKERKLNFSLDILTEQNNRLQNFAHIVSHNLRSHAGNIYALLDFHNRSEDHEEKILLIKHLTTAASNLNETVQDLTKVVEVQTSFVRERKQVNLYEYAMKTIDTLAADIKSKNATIQLNIAANVTISYNPSYLESILLNFITNAMKYRHPHRDPVIRLKAYHDGGHLVMEVADNGIGIDLKKYGAKLFGMYETFHGNKDARGVGLFLTRNQVDAMGGKIEVESTVGIGTTFKVYLQ